LDYAPKPAELASAGRGRGWAPLHPGRLLGCNRQQKSFRGRKIRCWCAAAPGRGLPSVFSTLPPPFAERNVVERQPAIDRLILLDASELDDRGPLLGFVDNQFPEIGRRAPKHRRAQFSKPRLDPGIGECRVDLAVELVDDFDRRVFGGTDPSPATRLVA